MGLINNLTNEIATRERRFERRLFKVRSDELKADYKAIQSLRAAINVIDGNSRDELGSTNITTLPPRPIGFVLTDAIRREIRLLEGRSFRSSEIFRALQNRYPTVVTKRCVQTVSATISNMANNSELVRKRVGRKLFYRER